MIFPKTSFLAVLLGSSNLAIQAILLRTSGPKESVPASEFSDGVLPDDAFTPFPYDPETSNPADGPAQFKQDLAVSAHLAAVLINKWNSTVAGLEAQYRYELKSDVTGELWNWFLADKFKDQLRSTDSDLAAEGLAVVGGGNSPTPGGVVNNKVPSSEFHVLASDGAPARRRLGFRRRMQQGYR